MFSIHKLIGRDGKFYDLLEASAQQADSSVHHLVALLEKLQQNETPEHLEEFAHSRREDKRITQELTEQLSKTFVTPLEREDIQELAAALYKIPETVLAMVKQLRKGIDAGTAREMNTKLQSIEGDADNLELNRLRDLFQGKYEPKQIIFLYDLYGLLEKVIDRCRDAGNIVLQVALKYS